MGRVHKKKIAEYAEAAENENEKGTEKSAIATVESSNSESDGEGDDDQKVRAKTNNAAKAGDGDGSEGDDDEFRSLQGDNDRDEDQQENSSAKKANKRKAAAANEENDYSQVEDSDDEPLNGGGANANVSTPKKGRKAGGGAKAKTAAKNGKAGRGKGKKAAQEKEAIEGEEEYEVKDIVGQKTERGVNYFLIRWKGYTKDDDTWEPEDTLSCPDIIERYKKKQADTGKSPKKGAAAVKRGRGKLPSAPADPNKEWEVEKIVDYAQEKTGRLFRIRWKGFGPKHDTWEPEENLSCDEIIAKFMKRMKSQENLTFKELREEPKKTKRLVNETAPRTNYHNPIGRKSRRSVARNRVYYGDSDE